MLFARFNRSYNCFVPSFSRFRHFPPSLPVVFRLLSTLTTLSVNINEQYSDSFSVRVILKKCLHVCPSRRRLFPNFDYSKTFILAVVSAHLLWAVFNSKAVYRYGHTCISIVYSSNNIHNLRRNIGYLTAILRARCAFGSPLFLQSSKVRVERGKGGRGISHLFEGIAGAIFVRPPFPIMTNELSSRVGQTDKVCTESKLCSNSLNSFISNGLGGH